jgi:hypothetical protein
MEPKEAAKKLREQAMHFSEVSFELRSRDASACDPRQILDWCAELLMTCAENKIHTAQILDDLSAVAAFEVVSSLDDPKMEEPPFERDFFLGLISEPSWWFDPEDSE